MILELGAGADILRAIGVIYWLLAIAVIGLVLWLGRKWWIKLPLSIAVLVLFIYPPYESLKVQKAEHDAYMARRTSAEELFKELCVGKAGEKIYRTVANVDGILLVKIRPNSDHKDHQNQFWPGAALSHESAEEWYIKSFLFDKSGGGIVQEFGGSERGYRYVDYVDPADNKRYRYSLRKQSNAISLSETPEIVLQRELATGAAPRYGVTYEDNVDPALRKHWIAGTTLKALDLNTDELLAVKTYFAFDTGLGYIDGNGRQPWLLAFSCEGLLGAPKLFVGSQNSQTRHFVDQVIKPIQAN